MYIYILKRSRRVSFASFVREYYEYRIEKRKSGKMQRFVDRCSSTIEPEVILSHVRVANGNKRLIRNG